MDIFCTETKHMCTLKKKTLGNQTNKMREKKQQQQQQNFSLHISSPKGAIFLSIISSSCTTPDKIS